jgi:hypothetical protein
MQKRSPIKRTAGIELWVQPYGCRNKSVSYPQVHFVGLDQGLGFRLNEKQRGSKATWKLQPDQKSKIKKSKEGMN